MDWAGDRALLAVELDAAQPAAITHESAVAHAFASDVAVNLGANGIHCEASSGTQRPPELPLYTSRAIA